MRTLYFYQDHGIPLGFCMKPAFDLDIQIYDSLSRVLSLRDDLKWHERYHLQNILAKAGIWDDFFTGYQLVAAEVHLEEFNQRCDLLYIDKRGGLFVCELKVGGRDKDAIGQVLRDIGELEITTIDMEWITKKAAKFRNIDPLDGIAFRLDRHCGKLHHFMKDNKIQEFHVITNTALIIEEAPDLRMLLGVQAANRGGNNFRVCNIQMKGLDDWVINDPVQYLRMDISNIDVDASISHRELIFQDAL